MPKVAKLHGGFSLICKKCVTAVSGDLKKCSSCGGTLRRYTNHKLWLLAMIVVMLVIISAVYIMYSLVFDQANIAERLDDTMLSQLSALGGSLENSGSPEDNDEAGIQPIPIFIADPNRTVPEIERIVKNAAETAEKFRDYHSKKREFVSMNGLLYDFPAKEYISTRDLRYVEGFNPEYSDNGVMILYVFAGDMPDEVAGDSNLDQLKVFAAYASGDSFIVTCGKHISIVDADFIKWIMDRYSIDHGTISRVSSTSELFADVLSELGELPGLHHLLDVRYMAEDDLYISAVVSPRRDSSLIREFVLQKTGSGCEVVVDYIETEWQKFVAINSVVPNINLELVPKYNLWYDLRDLITDFSDLLETMAESGVITPDDGEPIFISGNSEFVFMEFIDGIRILVHNDDINNEWKVYMVPQYDDAVLRMRESSKSDLPPYFLIRQA